jgi:hypothetical protein
MTAEQIHEMHCLGGARVTEGRRTGQAFCRVPFRHLKWILRCGRKDRVVEKRKIRRYIKLRDMYARESTLRQKEARKAQALAILVPRASLVSSTEAERPCPDEAKCRDKCSLT